MHKSQWFAGVGMLMALFSCGDDDGGGDAATPSSAAATCSKGCARAAAARCPNQPADCQQQCESQINATPAGCISYVNAYADCLNSSVFSCDATGAAEVRSCSQLLAAWQTCAGGGSNGSPMPDAGVPTDAAQSVPDSSLPDTSVPGVVPDAAVQDAAVQDAGPLECVPVPADGSCETCIKAACCPQVVACDAQCIALSDCGSECDSDDVECGAACNQQYPAGVTGLSALLNCANAACARACAEAPVSTNAIKLR